MDTALADGTWFRYGPQPRPATELPRYLRPGRTGRRWWERLVAFFA